MRNAKYMICFISLLLIFRQGFSQTFAANGKVEVLINNIWTEARIIKVVAGKRDVYEVQLEGSKDQRGVALKNSRQINADHIRVLKTTSVSGISALNAAAENDPHLGRYDLYSGIPTVYLGHLVLLKDGKYKVAFSTDEDNYENGAYSYHADNQTIEWLNGLFRNKSWGGKLVNKDGAFRIQFNKTTYADSN